MALHNPFYHRGPIRDSRFFWNRNEEIGWARGLLTQRQSVSLVGSRRIGKSSFLLNLSPADNSAHDRDPIHWVYFNCEAWSTAPPETLYALLAQTMAECGLLLPGIALSPTMQLDYRAFRQAILGVVQSQGRLVLLLDEFESLAMNPHLGADFFSGLRALATGDQVVFVTATTRSLGWLTFAEPSALSSPFFNIFTQINLHPFAVESAAAMLHHFSQQSGAPFADATVEFILSLAGPHPFFLQIAAYLAFAQMEPAGGALTPLAQERVRTDFLTQVEPHWRYIWQELPHAHRKHLALSLPLPRAAPDLLRRLRALALLVDGDHGPQLLSAHLGDFFAQQPVTGLVQAPPLVIDETQHRAILHGQEMDIYGLEYELLRLLALHAGDVILAATLQAALWPDEAAGEEGSERLKSVVKGLRRKLGSQASLIRNERGRGYGFVGKGG